MLLHFKRKVGQQRYGQAKKVRINNESHLLVTDAVLQSSVLSRSRSLEWAAATRVGMLRYSTTTTRKVKGPVLTTWSEEESLPWNVVDRHSFGKRSRQECRTVLKLGRNTFGLSTHHSNAKKRIKKQKLKNPSANTFATFYLHF